MHWQMRNWGLWGKSFVTGFFISWILSQWFPVCSQQEWSIWLDGVYVKKTWFKKKKKKTPLLEKMSTECKKEKFRAFSLCFGDAIGFRLSVSPCLRVLEAASLLKMNQYFSIRGIVSYNNHVNPQIQWYSFASSKAIKQRHALTKQCSF